MYELYLKITLVAEACGLKVSGYYILKNSLFVSIFGKGERRVEKISSSIVPRVSLSAEKCETLSKR